MMLLETFYLYMIYPLFHNFLHISKVKILYEFVANSWIFLSHFILSEAPSRENSPKLFNI